MVISPLVVIPEVVCDTTTGGDTTTYLVQRQLQVGPTTLPVFVGPTSTSTVTGRTYQVHFHNTVGLGLGPVIGMGTGRRSTSTGAGS